MRRDKCKTEIKSNPKSTNGLNIPGSNWERYKNIVNKVTKKDKKPKGESSKLKNNRNHLRKLSNVKISNMNKTTVENAPKIDKSGITKHIAIDCEMVGIGDGTESILARVSLVNHFGVCIYDKYVKPTEPIQDYRTAISGIRPEHLENAESFHVVQREVALIIRGRILIGHSLKNDFNVLFLKHPKKLIRDTARYKRFYKVSMGNTPSLKTLASELLGINIQSGEHNSIEDAKAAMELYLLYKNRWESDLRNKRWT